MAEKEAGRVARLSKTTVDGAQPGATRYILWDEELKGFGLRVEPSGVKTFIARYRVGGGRRGVRRQQVIGRYGTFTVGKAREDATEALRDAARGLDPQAKKAAERATLTVTELCEEYFAEGVATKKESTLVLDRIRVSGHIKPTLGGKRITEVTTADVDKLMNAIADGRIRKMKIDDDAEAEAKVGTRVRGGKGAATRTITLLRAIYNFAIVRKLCAENPTFGVKTFADNKRDRFLSPAELGRLGEALTSFAASADNLPGYQRAARLQHVQIVRMLLLTGARKNEIGRLRWSEVDAERGLLALEDSKTGKRKIKIGAGALEILAAIPRTKSPYVFPDPRDPKRPVRNLDWAWVGIRDRAELEDVRIHDLRHSFASMAVAGGASLYLVGKLLGHQHVQTTSRYAHLADDPVKAAAERVDSSILAALGGQLGDLKKIGGEAA